MTAFFLIAYFFGDKLAPYVVQWTQGSFLEVIQLSFWERVCRWSIAISFSAVGWLGYKRHQQLSKLRFLHRFTYERYQAIVRTPGSWYTDILWAYFTAVLLVNVPVGVTVSIVFVSPFFITKNWVFRLLLIIFFLSGINTFLRGAANILLETFRPRKLEAEIQGADKLTPQLEREYQHYLAQKEAEESISDKEVRDNDW